MQRQMICRVGEWLQAHSDLVYDPCNLTTISIHFFAVVIMAVSILVGTRVFNRRHSQNQD